MCMSSFLGVFALCLNDCELFCVFSMLGDFGDEMDQTSSRMDSVLKKLEKVSHMTSSKFTHTVTFLLFMSTNTLG